MFWRQAPLNRGKVINSVVIFTTGCPVITIEYNGSSLVEFETSKFRRKLLY